MRRRFSDPDSVSAREFASANSASANSRGVWISTHAGFVVRGQPVGTTTASRAASAQRNRWPTNSGAGGFFLPRRALGSGQPTRRGACHERGHVRDDAEGAEDVQREGLHHREPGPHQRAPERRRTCELPGAGGGEERQQEQAAEGQHADHRGREPQARTRRRSPEPSRRPTSGGRSPGRSATSRPSAPRWRRGPSHRRRGGRTSDGGGGFAWAQGLGSDGNAPGWRGAREALSRQGFGPVPGGDAPRQAAEGDSDPEGHRPPRNPSPDARSPVRNVFPLGARARRGGRDLMRPSPQGGRPPGMQAS